MLDLSAAFDVIDHPILLKRLEFSFGIKEKALTQVKSYLADRTQCFSVANKTAPYLRSSFWCTTGVRFRTKELLYAYQTSIKQYSIKYHCYVDDTQVYMTLKRSDKWNDISSSIEASIADLSTWKKSNKLKLNKDKT